VSGDMATMNDSWNPLDLTPTRMGVVIAIALVAAIIFAQWSKHQTRDDGALTRVEAPAAGSAAPAMPSDPSAPGSVRAVVPPAVMTTCDRYAATRTGHPGKRALGDLEEMKKHDERYRRAYASCLGSHGYTG